MTGCFIPESIFKFDVVICESIRVSTNDNTNQISKLRLVSENIIKT